MTHGVHTIKNFRNLSTLLVLLGLTALLGLSRVARSEDKTTPSHPCPIDADLWILAGQSNMEGWGKLKDTDAQPKNPRIVMFNMSNEWLPACDPLHRLYEAAAPVHRNIYLGPSQNDPQKLKEAIAVWDKSKAQSKAGNPPGGVGPGMAFARQIEKYSGRPVGLIPCSHGGSSLDQWDPAQKDKGDDSLYGAMLNRVKMVGGGAKIKGLLWYQGETDALCKVPKYEERFLKFIDSLRADLGQPDLPIICVQIGRLVGPDFVTPQGPSSAPNWEEVREIQRRVPTLRKNVYTVAGIDLTLDDPIHVSAEGQARLGRRMAEVALSEVYHQPGHATPIDLASVKVDPARPNVIRLHFSGVSGRLIAPGRPIQFELRAADEAAKTAVPSIFRVDFDPEDLAGIELVLSAPVTSPLKLVCGAGLDPYLNIVDEKDMPVPAFGPVEVPLNVPVNK